jgi:hypothetical protein
VTTTRRAAAVTAAATALFAGCGGPGDGPVAEPPAPHGSTYTLPQGTVFTDGLEVVFLEGENPAVIDSVELKGEGLELIGLSLATPDRPGGVIRRMKGYPPRDPELPPEVIVPATGATIEPGKDNAYEILLGLKVTGQGHLINEGFWLNYTVDGKEFRDWYAYEIAVCTDKSLETQGHCPPSHELDPSRRS